MLYMILNARLLRSNIFVKLVLAETRIQGKIGFEMKKFTVTTIDEKKKNEGKFWSHVGERLMHQWRRVKLIQS